MAPYCIITLPVRTSAGQGLSRMTSGTSPQLEATAPNSDPATKPEAMPTEMRVGQSSGRSTERLILAALAVQSLSGGASGLRTHEGGAHWSWLLDRSSHLPSDDTGRLSDVVLVLFRRTLWSGVSRAGDAVSSPSQSLAEALGRPPLMQEDTPASDSVSISSFSSLGEWTMAKKKGAFSPPPGPPFFDAEEFQQVKEPGLLPRYFKLQYILCWQL